MTAYYNEIDPFAAQWLRNLIQAGHIAAGEVDERDIRDVTPGDLDGFTQCHFFAGIGGWSLALRLAGWPDDKPVWTGSCPCQPFSAAGKGGGVDDERHLWPDWYWLISQCRPAVIFGEQVASKDALAWFDLVQADLEGSDYAVGVADLCSAGVGAPHLRQRLHFVAAAAAIDSERHSAISRLGDPFSPRLEGHAGNEDNTAGRAIEVGSVAASGGAGGLDNPISDGRGARRHDDREDDRLITNPVGELGEGLPGPTNGIWRAADWLFCRDGKWRAVRPGSFPLAHGVPGRVGRIRAYGNAINPEVAAEFITASTN